MMRTRIAGWAWGGSVLGPVLSGTLAVGCVPQFVDDVSQVEGFRVLAVRADPAEVAPGASAELTVLWATPEGQPVDASELTWGLCDQRRELTEPGPVSPDCISEFGDADSEIITYLGSGASAPARIPSDVCRTFGPLAPPAEGDGFVPGRPVDPDATGGFYQPVLVGQDDATLGGIRLSCGTPWLPQEELIVFNQGYRPNEHPEFAALTRQDDDSPEDVDPEVPLEVKVGEEVRFGVSWAECPEEPDCGDGLCTMGENGTDCAEDCGTDPVGCTGAEPYLLADVKTRTTIPAREKVSVAWFTTGGTFESSVTDDTEGKDETANVWTAPDEATDITLWLVLRDDRGGVSWRELRVEVTEP